jgi:transcription elongation factor Elf1
MGEITLDGITFTEPDFECPRCMNLDLAYTYIRTNNSIQARCSNCGKWYGNVKHDNRPKAEKIKDAMARKENINNARL